MKNVLKRFLCAVMMLSLIMTAAPAAFAADEVHLLEVTFDGLADGAKDSLSSSEFTHTKYDYSNGTQTNSNTEVTEFSKVSIGSSTSMEIGSAGYGKSGKALIYKVNGATANQETMHDFKWAPTVYSSDKYGKTDIQVTYEISLRAPENITGGTQTYEVMVPFGGKYITLIKLETSDKNVSKISGYSKATLSDGKSSSPVTLCNWTPGQWNNVSVTLTPGTQKLDYYLNGVYAFSGESDAVYAYAGGRFRLVHKATVVSGSTYTSNMAIDDVSIYFGTPETAKYSTEISSSAYSITNGTISLGSASVDHDTFVNGLSVANGGSVEVYTDSTYSTVAEVVTEGCKVVATSANGRVLDCYTVAEKEVILDCDMESSYGIAENAVPSYEGNLVGSNDTGKGSLGFTTGFSTYATGNVKSAGAAKDGYAYFFDVNNTTDASASPGIDFKFVPNVTAGKVTFEISMLAPENYDTIRPALYVPYNTNYKVLFAFQTDGKLAVNNAYICQWIPGRWYNFAVELTAGSGVADFYLNGDKVLDDAEVYVNLNSDGVIGVIGGRMRFEATAAAGVSDVTAFDDVKVYTGGYEAALNEVLVESNSEDYSVSEFGYIFTPDSSVRVNSLKNYISGTFAVYEDDTFESTAAYTGEGQVLVATSENGNVVKYYTLVPDGKIAVTVNNSATTKLSSRETVTIGAMANCENAYVFAASYDSEGNFIGADLVSANGATNTPAKVSFNTKAGDIVKLMLWDKTSLKPVGDMVTIQK